MPDRSVLAYVFDGTFEGFLTAVFEAYARHENPDIFSGDNCLQTCFGLHTEHIRTDAAKALRVEKGLTSKIGSMAYNKIWTVFLSGNPDRATLLYRYIRTGLKIGRRIYNALANEHVLAVNNLELHIINETQKLRGFTRFSQMENGVYFGRITPYNSAVPLLMPHFADRFSDQPFLLYDAAHHLAGVYDLQGWRLIETDGIDLPDYAPDEMEYRRMWLQFYKSVAIKERMNPTCQRNLMPKRYWQNMHEHSFVETPATSRKAKPQQAVAVIEAHG